MKVLHHNPLLAASYDFLVGPFERRVLAPLRARLLEDVAGQVVDLGAGTGANFPYLSSSVVALTAVEPDSGMLRRAKVRAKGLGLPITFVQAPLEALPMPDASFDVAVTALVLCTVADPAAGLAEIRRVLKPGGELRFLEHVRADGSTGQWQDRLRPVWARLAGGCQLNRDTRAILMAAGFEPAAEQLPMPFPLGRILVGRARLSERFQRQGAR